jgi:hypothetical protein
MLVEPAGTINTGDTIGDLTAEDDVWIRILKHFFRNKPENHPDSLDDG